MRRLSRRARAAIASIAVLVALGPGRSAPTAQEAGPAVMLVTLDGARVEEVFGGLDAGVLASTLGGQQRLEDHPIYRRFWAATPEERRQRLLPFFWGTLMREHGSIAGNRALGSRVTLRNRHWFSYPGYAEMLLGRAHDGRIASNDPVRVPFPTVLEFLRRELKAPPEGVALFGSWSVFNAIAESTEGAITVNAGFESMAGVDSSRAILSDLQYETQTPWDSVRHDAYTFKLAMAHLERHRPRVLYLALGETDDWAHDGRYDRVLEAFARSDAYLRLLWEWIESQPDYRGRTSLLLTTDHGRGRSPQDWRDHGAKVQGAEDTWIAFVSPSLARRGEWRDHPTLHTAQVASTLITWMGLDWRAFDPAADPPVR